MKYAFLNPSICIMQYPIYNEANSVYDKYTNVHVFDYTDELFTQMLLSSMFSDKYNNYHYQ